MRILIVEDNRTTAEFLQKGLVENYFIPEITGNGQEGFFLATQFQYDLIILDMMVPILDGWSFITRMREKNNQTPILCLTAKDTIEDRVRGLELGADDYLIKPFAFSELLARIRTILRRNITITDDIVQVADLKIDTLKHKVWREHQSIPLSPKEFLLLLLLARRKGEVLSRTFIAEQVWDINFDCDTNAIDVAIKRLRDKIDKDFTQKLIHSVRGVGYVLEER